ncbi:UvrD-helicase domain-containing protein [Nocardiopsis suaedae]|uniref:DNA 3'-5' helicase n=1 Tax=Nocardiopsis suaedae TaxID=3018444 RepID=A0ABT4TGF8_9ACTN|nr:UvrD-helicase domain-containing protein [Nocardiopsis suaedae]MDA2803800.1 AAA family ATPase [Nocardiopsis suaedae]
MPKLVITPTFLSDFSRLDPGVRGAALTVVQAFMDGDENRLETVADAADPRTRLLRIGPEWAGVLVPGTGDGTYLLGVRRQDDALAMARDRTAVPEDGAELAPEPPPVPAGAPRVTGPDELDLGASFDEWQLTLHPDQHRIVDARYAGSAQISGGPGTGKTVLALHRAAHLASRESADSPDARRTVLLTTYNRLLAQTLSGQLDRLLPDPRVRARVEVVTVDSLARGIVHEHTGLLPDALGRDTLAERWREAANDDGLPFSGRFLADEWEQVVLAQNLTRLSDYVRCERSGRVLHLAPEHRPQVWDAIRRYTAAMRVAGEWSYPQIALAAAEHLGRVGPRYRHVVVDEAQDLHPAQWRLLRAAVPEGPDDLFIVGDPHQRISDNRVSLASLGINVRGRGHRLRVSYRVSQEILDWAVPILGRRPEVGLDDDADALTGYRSLLHGPEPVLRGCRDRADERAALAEWVRVWLEAGVAPSSVAVAGRNQWVVRHMAKELQARGIPTAPLDAVDTSPAVRVGTMHKLKGQEFRCVAVVGVSEPLLPPKAALDAAEGDPVALEQVYQQERNLLFLACTRARDALYVSYVGAPSRLVPHGVRAAEEETAAV